MARRREGHLLFQADLNKQLCNKCIINEKLIIPVCKHFTPLVPTGALDSVEAWPPPHLCLGSGDAWGGGGMPGRTEEAPHDGWRQFCSHLRVSAVLICFFLLGDTLNFSKIKAQVESFPWNLRTVSFFFLESWFPLME